MKTLMETIINLTITNNEDLDKLYNFLKGTNIQMKVLHSNMVLMTSEMKKYDYIPTEEFKNFCGSENLNRDGYISISSAYNFVILYAKQRSIYFPTHIDLDKTLIEVLKTNHHTLKHSELMDIIINLFKRKV